MGLTVTLLILVTLLETVFHDQHVYRTVGLPLYCECIWSVAKKLISLLTFDSKS